MGKLYIYDVSSATDRRQADGRFSSSEGLTTIKASNVNELLHALDQLIAQKKRFNRALFQTHGNSGAIFFGSDRVDASLLRSKFQARLYNRLFMFNARQARGGQVLQSNIGSGRVHPWLARYALNIPVPSTMSRVVATPGRTLWWMIRTARSSWISAPTSSIASGGAVTPSA